MHINENKRITKKDLNSEQEDEIRNICEQMHNGKQ